MQFCSSSVSVSLRPSCSPADQPRQQILVGIARACGAVLDQALQIGRKVAHRIVAERHLLLGVSTGSSAPRIASDQPRNGPRSACGTPSRLPMISTGMAAAKSSIRSARPLSRHRVEQSVDQRDQPGLHLGDHAVRQRHLDRAAHMGVQRRIVEHEAGGVVLEQRRVAVFRAELDLLVGGEHARVAIDRVAIAPARDQVGAVRHAMHRIVLAQRAVIGKRIVDEVRRQPLEIEIARGRARLLGRNLAGATSAMLMAFLDCADHRKGGRRCQGTLPLPLHADQVRSKSRGATPMDKDGSIAPRRRSAKRAPTRRRSSSKNSCPTGSTWWRRSPRRRSRASMRSATASACRNGACS